MNNIIIQDGTEAICNHCYAGNHDVNYVSIAGSVKEIGVGAFSDCTSLETVTINEGLKRLKKEVFSGCRSLREINIPGSLQSIGEWAFRDCRSLSLLQLPPGITEICEEAFLSCPLLTIRAEKGTYAAEFAMRHGIPLQEGAL